MKKETTLKLTPAGFKTWKLDSEFIQEIGFTADINGKVQFEITVPKGFETNLASTPRFLWAILPPFGRYTQASVIHDYLYYSHEFIRSVSDRIFYELMLRYGTYKWKAKLMFWAVRLFGRFAW